MNPFNDNKLLEQPYIDIPLETRSSDVPSAKRTTGAEYFKASDIFLFPYLNILIDDMGSLEIILPANSHVGYFGMLVVVDVDKRPIAVASKARLVVLFNPWNSDDETHISGTLYN